MSFRLLRFWCVWLVPFCVALGKGCPFLGSVALCDFVCVLCCFGVALPWGAMFASPRVVGVASLQGVHLASLWVVCGTMPWDLHFAPVGCGRGSLRGVDFASLWIVTVVCRGLFVLWVLLLDFFTAIRRILRACFIAALVQTCRENRGVPQVAELTLISSQCPTSWSCCFNCQFGRRHHVNSARASQFRCHGVCFTLTTLTS